MILLISDTPVAGTVERLAKWIEKLSGVETTALIKRNYPNHAFEITNGCFDCMPNWESYIAKMIRASNLIILHNVLDNKVLDIVFREKRSSVDVLYQLHSPPLEGPHYAYSVLEKYKFDAILAVNQGHGRFIRNSIPVPNIIQDFKLSEVPEKQNLLFVPHMRTTNFRWSNKFSLENSKVLDESKHLFKHTKLATIQGMFGRDVVSHSEIQFVLQFCSLIVDDLNTGLIHQTAMEGLKSGCGVFSNADMYTVEEYCSSIDAPTLPLIYIDETTDIVKFLIKNTCEEYMEKQGDNIRNYSKNYLSEERLAKIYFNVIKNYIA